MMQAVFLQALLEYTRVKRLLPWAVLALVLGLITLGWHSIDPQSVPLDQYSTISSVLIFKVLALASVIFTTAIVTAEVEQKTIVYLLTRPVPRWILLLMRYAASAIVVTLISGFCAVTVSIGAYGSHFLSNPLLGRDILALGIGAIAYGALFLLISLLFNKAMIICLLFAFGWESAAPNMPGDVYYLSIASYLQAIMHHPSNNVREGIKLLTGTLQGNTLQESTGLLALVGSAVVFVGISLVWFSQFEYVPREEAG